MVKNSSCKTEGDLVMNERISTNSTVALNLCGVSNGLPGRNCTARKSRPHRGFVQSTFPARFFPTNRILPQPASNLRGGMLRYSSEAGKSKQYALPPVEPYRRGDHRAIASQGLVDSLPRLGSRRAGYPNSPQLYLRSYAKSFSSPPSRFSRGIRKRQVPAMPDRSGQ